MQQLIDCDMTDLGCGGGLMDQAFQYDEDSVGLCALDDYPFAYHRHWFYGCSRYMPYCSPLPNSKVKKFVDVNKTEDALKAAIATQPVSVAVTAGPLDWQFYRKGIFNGGCDAEIDHGVLAVGYGHYDPKQDPDASADSAEGDFWLIKNSWGEHWGMNGCEFLALQCLYAKSIIALFCFAENPVGQSASFCFILARSPCIRHSTRPRGR